MNDITPELRAAIDTAKARIKPESYYPVAMNGSVKGNSQGLWAGTMMGMGSGAIVGTALWGITALMGIALPVSPIGIITGMTALGGSTGFAAGARLGGAAGSAAAIAAERERRDRADALEKEVLASPEKQAEVIEAYRKDPVVERSTNLQELSATTRGGAGALFGKIFAEPKTMLTLIALSAIAGVVLYSGGTALGLASGLGNIGITGPGIGAAVGAGMGVLFGINFPVLFTSLTQFASDLVSGKMMRGESSYKRVKTIPEIEAEVVQNRIVSERPRDLPHITSAAPGAALIGARPTAEIAAPAAAVARAFDAPALVQGIGG